MYNMLLAGNRSGERGRLKIITLFILIFLIAASFSAEVLIIATINHECVGEDCPICEHVRKAKALDALIDELIASAVIVLILTACLFAVADAPFRNITLGIRSATLVGIKIRMNN